MANDRDYGEGAMAGKTDAAEGPLVRVDRADGVARLTLNRPDVLNALTPELLQALAAALDTAVESEGVRAILLTGAGRAFCAGQDLRHPSVADPAKLGGVAALLRATYHPVIERLVNGPLPVVCAVNGVAAGAGANLALACDVVVAAQSAIFVEAFVNIGLVPDAGGTYFLPRLVGRARALGLAMLGEPLTAERAVDWGLIWRAVPDDALLDEAAALAGKLAQGPTLALGLMKRAIAGTPQATLAEQLELEATLQTEAAATADAAEGIAAFVDKRPPRFTGS
jgi:2-(1,2-epoxy-1,2-dihydrophenyl)acetyl-CoA isomerase